MVTRGLEIRVLLISLEVASPSSFNARARCTGMDMSQPLSLFPQRHGYLSLEQWAAVTETFEAPRFEDYLQARQPGSTTHVKMQSHRASILRRQMNRSQGGDFAVQLFLKKEVSFRTRRRRAYRVIRLCSAIRNATCPVARSCRTQSIPRFAPCQNTLCSNNRQHRQYPHKLASHRPDSGHNVKA